MPEETINNASFKIDNECDDVVLIESDPTRMTPRETLLAMVKKTITDKLNQEKFILSKEYEIDEVKTSVERYRQLTAEYKPMVKRLRQQVLVAEKENEILSRKEQFVHEISAKIRDEYKNFKQLRDNFVKVEQILRENMSFRLEKLDDLERCAHEIKKIYDDTAVIREITDQLSVSIGRKVAKIDDAKNDEALILSKLDEQKVIIQQKVEENIQLKSEINCLSTKIDKIRLSNEQCAMKLSESYENLEKIVAEIQIYTTKIGGSLQKIAQRFNVFDQFDGINEKHLHFLEKKRTEFESNTKAVEESSLIYDEKSNSHGLLRSEIETLKSGLENKTATLDELQQQYMKQICQTDSLNVLKNINLEETVKTITDSDKFALAEKLTFDFQNEIQQLMMENEVSQQTIIQLDEEINVINRDQVFLEEKIKLRQQNHKKEKDENERIMKNKENVHSTLQTELNKLNADTEQMNILFNQQVAENAQLNNQIEEIEKETEQMAEKLEKLSRWKMEIFCQMREYKLNSAKIVTQKMTTAKKSFSREEELLLQDYSRHLSTKSSVIFYGNAFIVAANSVFLFWRIHQMDLQKSAILFGVVTVLITWLIAYAYRNVKFVLKHRIAPKRNEAVTREVSKAMNDDKKIGKKERDERILWLKNDIADYEAATFSIFYNNSLFLTMVLFFSFYLLASLTPSFNYVVSVSLAAFLLALFSNSTR